MRSSPMSTRCAGRTCGGWRRISSCPTAWRSRRSAHLASSRRSEGTSRKRWAPVQVHRVVVAGAAGRMGRAAVRTISRRDDMLLVGALGHTTALGQDAGTVAGSGAIGVPITTDLPEIFLVGRPTVLVDLSRGEGAAERALVAFDHQVPVVIGATGIPPDAVASLRDRAEAPGAGAIIAPTFALGALLMMEFARRAARVFPHAEVIVRHDHRTRDAPSGTAARTARLMAEARGSA